MNVQKAAIVEKQETAIKRKERREFKASSGSLTKCEKRNLNREENHDSNEIN